MTEKETILIVEDCPMNRKLLKQLLTHHGYQVRDVDSGQAALQAVQQELPDLMAVDVMMPEMDGYSLCRELKKDKKTMSIPVIFISALDEIGDKLAGFEAGGVDYITKPFQSAEVLARITTHMELCRLRWQLEERNRLLNEEKKKTESLLRNLLPMKVAEELMETGRYRPRSFEQVTVCFIDIVAFTATSARLEPELIINELDDIFTEFDRIANEYRCERIKIIGDAYLFACGVPEERQDHAWLAIQAARQMVACLDKRNLAARQPWLVRVGLDSGKVVGGIVGSQKYLYDIFGDTVNLAARMEELSLPMRVNISAATHALVEDRFTFTRRSDITVKGKGRLSMYFVEDEVVN
jgi:class 3 adenylate cyclase